ncbi:Uncharacterised protein [Mycobacteroides abscessus subsp. abscessus]|nr:Uncharacterised protein [Mycobacteroides abscessus subsp. abscessus]
MRCFNETSFNFEVTTDLGIVDIVFNLWRNVAEPAFVSQFFGQLSHVRNVITGNVILVCGEFDHVVVPFANKLFDSWVNLGAFQRFDGCGSFVDLANR